MFFSHMLGNRLACRFLQKFSIVPLEVFLEVKPLVLGEINEECMDGKVAFYPHHPEIP